MTATDEAIDMATVAAQAAAAKLADDVVVIDVSGQLVITDCFVIASASNERQVNAIVDEVEEKMRRRGLQAGPPRGHPRGPLGAARLRRHRRAHPASGRAQLLCAGPAVAGLPRRCRWTWTAQPVRVRRLVMLRHGQTEYNAGSRMQGQLDTDLTDLGRDQAVAAAEVLAKRQPLLIVSSDLRRALDTAVGARRARRDAGARRHPAARDASRRLAGHDAPRGRRRAPGARLAWRDDARWAPHGGESRVDVAARSMPLVAELIAESDRVGCRRTRTGPSCWSRTAG